MSETLSPDKLILRIAEVAHAIGFQSNTPGVEMASAIVSHLAAHPEHIEDFIKEGAELFIDGRMTLISGCLSHRCGDGLIRQSKEIRKLNGDRDA